MRAFENGADGVFVAGCEEGSCHFVEGNFIARRRVNYAREILSETGLDKERLRMINIGAADPRPFVDKIKDMVETVRDLGPNPMGRPASTSSGIFFLSATIMDVSPVYLLKQKERKYLNLLKYYKGIKKSWYWDAAHALPCAFQEENVK